MKRPSSAAVDVVVIGAGAIGLSIGWRAATAGLRVLVLERGRPGSGASHHAAGMLAPVAEAAAGEEPLLALGLRSAKLFGGFVSELEAASGGSVGYMRCGTLLVARDGDEAEALERELALRTDLGLHVERLRASAARRLEPALAPTLRLALDLPADHAVDPRKLLAGLTSALGAAGGELRCETPVVSVDLEQAGVRARGASVDAERAGATARGGSVDVERPGATARGGSVGGERPGARARGVVLADGTAVRAEHVVVCAGAWSGSLGGLAADRLVPLRPVKGQIVRLHDPAGPGLLTRVIRMGSSYITPRGDGRYVIGATSEERGFDQTVTAGAMFELLRDASELVPGVSELVVDELTAGLRPATPDNLPAIGAAPDVDGLWWAVGHRRGGILLAPLTAQLIVDGILGQNVERTAELSGAFDPGRFAGRSGAAASNGAALGAAVASGGAALRAAAASSGAALGATASGGAALGAAAFRSTV